MLVCHMLGSCYFEISDKGPGMRFHGLSQTELTFYLDAWKLFQVLVKCAEMCLGFTHPKEDSENLLIAITRCKYVRGRC